MVQEAQRHNDRTGGGVGRWESRIALISPLYRKGRAFRRNYAVQPACFVKRDYRPRPGFAFCFVTCNSLPSTLAAQSGIDCAALLNLPPVNWATTR